MRNVDIFGTCLTRELFNTTEEYAVNNYLMQQSIFTLFSKPLYVDESEIKSHDNYNFKNRMLYYELNKIGLDNLLKNHTKYLVIDLADVGRNILKFSVPSNVSVISTQDIIYTLDFLSKNRKLEYEVYDVRNYTDEQIEIELKKFIAILLKEYNPNNIILNRVQMNNVYYENNVEKKIYDCFIYNRLSFIKRVEDIFLRLLPNCKILCSNYEPVLDINHRFGGPHPAHFEKIYYEYKMKLLDSLITGEISSIEIDDQYKKIYNNEIQRIKSKKIIK